MALPCPSELRGRALPRVAGGHWCSPALAQDRILLAQRAATGTQVDAALALCGGSARNAEGGRISPPSSSSSCWVSSSSSWSSSAPSRTCAAAFATRATSSTKAFSSTTSATFATTSSCSSSSSSSSRAVCSAAPGHHKRRCRRSTLWWLWAAALCGALPRGAEAISKQLSEQTNSLWIWIASNVGLEPASSISIDLTNDKPANETYVVVLTHDQWNSWTLRPDPGDAPFDGNLVSFWRGVLTDSLQARFSVKALAKDRYNVGILNPQKNILALKGTVSLLNPGGEQLPLQTQTLPSVLLFTSLLFIGTCGLAAALLALTRRTRSLFGSGRASPVHLVMATAVALKGVVLLLWWLDCVQLARTGYDSAVTGIGWQLLDKVQTIVELMMFLLIALGWKILRNTLQVTEVRFAVGLSVISFYLGVFEVSCTTQSSCSGYQLSRYILHSLCYLVVIVAMNFNLQIIYAQLVDAPASLESSKLYRKYQAYRLFRWIFLAFIIAPTVELFLKVSIIPWDATWLYVLLEELRTWAIYVALLAAFRPDPAPLRVFELTRDAGSDDEGGPELGGAADMAE